MNKDTKVVLLSLIAIVQVLTLAGGFLAYQQMAETVWRSEVDYQKLYKETHSGILIDPGIVPNPFSPLVPLVLFGLLATAVLLFDQVRHKNTENKA